MTSSVEASGFPGNTSVNTEVCADSEGTVEVSCSWTIPTIINNRLVSSYKQRDLRSPIRMNVSINEYFVPNIFTANIRGGFAQKTDELETVLRCNNVDIACITETWLRETVPSDILNISDYAVHRSDRQDGRRGGGVAAIVRCGAPCQRMTELESPNVESVWLLYRRPRMPRALSHVVVGIIYHPPSADDRVMIAHILDCLDKITRQHPQSGVILTGDFNKLRDAAILAYPLKQIVRSPTRGSAILDKMYTNLQEWYGQPVILPNIGRSDHNAVLITAQSTSKRQRGEDIEVMVRPHDTNGKALLAQAIQSINWTPLYQMGTCEEMTACFYDTITSLVDYHLPLRNAKRHSTDKPWVTDQFRRLIRCRQNALKNGQTDRYKMYRNKVQRATKQLRRKFYTREIHNLQNSDQRKWWRSVKQITGLSRSSTMPLQSLANQLHDGDIHELASSINLFFQQVADDLQPLADDVAPPLPNAIPDEFVIDPAAVEVKMSQIKVNKAPGPDGLPNWVLRDFCGQLAGPVCAIFNASLREGCVPARWKEANVVPVPKVYPPRSVTSDLRPIALTATLGKVLESFVGSWILQTVESNLDGCQYGGLKRRSTTHALIDMLHHWHDAVDKGQSVRAVFVDFAKAFDHVDHDILVTKLRRFGLSDTVMCWMCDFLRHRTQRVKIGDVLSDWLPISAGMPQGSFLGPLTFIILVDGMTAGDFTHKYIDDTTLTELISRPATSRMQLVVDDLAFQASQCHMNINGKKTKEMLIGQLRRNAPPSLMLDGTEIERVTVFKLLGIHISDNLKWAQHVNMLASKVASRLYFLKQLKRSGAPTEDLVCFYTSVIRTVLEYACPVWHSSLTTGQSDMLESLQKRALRIIYSDMDYHTSLFLAELDTLYSRREHLTQRFYKRNIDCSSSCLNYLLPEQRDFVTKLRRASKYESFRTRTERFRNSCIPYCVSKFRC